MRTLLILGVAALAFALAQTTVIPTDQGFTDAFVVSAVIAACPGVVALFIQRAAESMHAPALREVGAASPLGEPAFSAEDS